MNNRQNISTIVLSGVSGGLIAFLIFFSFMGPVKNQPVDTSPAISFSKNYTSQQDLVVSAVEKASPAVVSVIITKDVPVLEQYYEDLGFNFSIPKYRDSGETEKKEIGGGSGFIVSDDGYIITNKHVVDQEDAEYTIFDQDGGSYPAEVIDIDSFNDLAVLKIDAKDLPYLEFSDSDQLKVGQTVIAIGNPLLQFSNSVSVGVVSGLARTITAGGQFQGAATEQLDGVIQTDAAINPGNSGGPLLDTDGKVIGVNVAVATAENIGFSIPSNIVSNIVDSVRENGRIIHPYLGIRYMQINPSLKEANNLSVDEGVLIIRGASAEELAVLPSSPADKAGLTENDIILEIDGQKLDKDHGLAKLVASKKVGDSVKLKIIHRGEEKEVTVILEEAPKN